MLVAFMVIASGTRLLVLSIRRLQCNLKLGQSELNEGKPACTYWRSVPISENAVMRLQPALPPVEGGWAQQYPSQTSEHVVASVWAMEAYFMVRYLAVVLVT